MRTTTFKIASFFILLNLLIVETQASELYKKSEFSISLPDGWVEIPRNVIDAYEIETAKLAPEAPKQHYDYVFQLRSVKNWFEYPFITVQINKMGKISENELENMENYPTQKEVNKHKEKLSSAMTDIQVGKMYYDKDSRIIWLRMESKVINVGYISGLSGVILTEQGFIQVNGYSLKNDFPRYEPVFKSSTLSVEPCLRAETKWYENGTLYQASVKEWQNATFENKLATAADWAMRKQEINDKIKKTRVIDDLKPIAQELVECLDMTTAAAAADKKSQNISVSLYADSCLMLMKGKFY